MLGSVPSPPSTAEQREVPPAQRAGSRGIIRCGFFTAQLLIPYRAAVVLCTAVLTHPMDHSGLLSVIPSLDELPPPQPRVCGSPPCALTRSAFNPGHGRCIRFSRPWREQSSRVQSSHVWLWAWGHASSRCAGRVLEVCRRHTGSVLEACCHLACHCHCTAGSSAGSAGPCVLRGAHWDTCVRETAWDVAGSRMRRERNEIPGNSLSAVLAVLTPGSLSQGSQQQAVLESRTWGRVVRLGIPLSAAILTLPMPLGKASSILVKIQDTGCYVSRSEGRMPRMYLCPCFCWKHSSYDMCTAAGTPWVFYLSEHLALLSVVCSRQCETILKQSAFKKRVFHFSPQFLNFMGMFLSCVLQGQVLKLFVV